MFDTLSENLTGIFKRLKSKGLLTEDDVNVAMREIRVALLEADVALPVVKDFTAKVKDKAIGQQVVRSVSPGQMVVKIVHDQLVEMLGEESKGLDLAASPPVVVMMVGLQGSGKTTSTGKLALHLRNKQKKKVLMASLDVYRPAAQEQLTVLGKQLAIDTLPIVPKEKPVAITKRALEEAKKGGYDVLLLDTAGRLHIDDALMQELQEVKALSKPKEVLLVADALTGQDAVNIARQFHEKVEVTGIILTRIDGDGRGGAALSMRAVTGCPIKFLGTGEKIPEFETFHPDRIASRILGMGDVVSLVEKAAQSVADEDTEKMARRLEKGQFDMDDLSKQLNMMRKMGGFGSIMNMLPGMGKFKQQVEKANIDDKMLIHMQALISSMTRKERRFPALINASRKKRIAAGAGRTVQEVNRLLKQYKQMSQMVKKISKMDKKALMRGGLGNFLPKG